MGMAVAVGGTVFGYGKSSCCGDVMMMRMTTMNVGGKIE
jgi:hypothetical protein